MMFFQRVALFFCVFVVYEAPRDASIVGEKVMILISGES